MKNIHPFKLNEKYTLFYRYCISSFEGQPKSAKHDEILLMLPKWVGGLSDMNPFKKKNL